MPADRESHASRSTHTRVAFGGTEATPEHLVLTTSISDLARAEFRLLLDDSEAAAPDYHALVEIEIDEHSVFTGTTVTATPALSGVETKCASGVELNEGLMGRLSLEDAPVQDVVFAAARAAGFPESRIDIHGLEDLPLEPIEVVVPLRGVLVKAPCRVGRVELHPPPLGNRALEAFHLLPPEFVAEFEAAQSYAVVVHTVRRLYDAEVLALADVDAVLAWLPVRARYGHSRLPDGQAQRFRRDDARCLPERAELIAVRGLRSGRRWVRDPQGLAQHPDLSLDTSDVHLWPALPARFRFADRHAVLAARRAAADRDYVERITAFWEAWEFYTAEIQPQQSFTKDELKRLCEELPDWLTPEQRRRTEEVLQLTSGASLMSKLRTALERDGVPITDAEWNLLVRLRRLRNRTTHGATAEAPAQEDLELGLSLLSRALVHRVWAREDRQGPY